MKKVTDLSMNEAFAELEQIVGDFEEGKIDLEESITSFKRGLEVARHLKERLKTLENEIVEIKAQFKEPEKTAPEPAELDEPVDPELPF